MKVLVTGANGFVGRALVNALRERSDDPVVVVRHATEEGQIGIGDIGPDTDWSSALKGCESVVHCAARVHQMVDQGMQSAAEYRRANTEGTLNLAKQAATAGVKRFVFLSSIKAMGEEGTFSPNDPCFPVDAYG